MNFSAVILAGGKSSRMGRDKAWLEIGGRSLLARQIGMVGELGATEIFISGRAEVDYSQFGCRVLCDKFVEAGPLAGIERGLDAATAPLLLVLAVDLPELSVEFFRRLAATCSGSLGAIPRVNGYIEPLAAFYPKATQTIAGKMLLRNTFAVKDFALGCVQAKHAKFVDFPAADAVGFNNCNLPSDYASLARSQNL